MPKGISLDGVNAAGGMMQSLNQDYVTADGSLIIVVGDKVLSHGDHDGDISMVTGIDWITIDGVPIVTAECFASCGHQSNGSDWITVDE